ncbi:MAG: hypothetical protein AB8D78_06020 [Akkermansiaceae bacterium]
MKKTILSTAMVAAYLTLSSQGVTILPGDPLNPGLSAGQSFQLVFVTSTRVRGDSVDATPNDGLDTSTSADWNNYVNSVASSSGTTALAGLAWSAIVSVQNRSNPSDLGVAAKVNAPVLADVYNTNSAGSQLVATAANFYTSNHLLPILFGEDGNAINTQGGSGAGRLVWTGSTGTGDIDSRPLGNSPISSTGNNGSRTGNAPASNDDWINRSDAERRGPTTPLRVYALSELITIAAPIPEPSTTILGAFGALLLLLRRRN